MWRVNFLIYLKLSINLLILIHRKISAYEGFIPVSKSVAAFTGHFPFRACSKWFYFWSDKTNASFFFLYMSFTSLYAHLGFFFFEKALMLLLFCLNMIGKAVAFFVFVIILYFIYFAYAMLLLPVEFS